MNLWSLASNLKTNLTGTDNTNENQILKEEIERLKKEIEEKETKYNNLVEEVHKKEVPLEENEYEHLIDKIVKNNKAYLLSVLGKDKGLSDKINETFINPKKEDFIDNVSKLSSLIRPMMLKELYGIQKDKIELFISQELLKKINLLEVKHNDDITEDEYKTIFHDIFEELFTQIEKNSKDSSDKEEKIRQYEEKFKNLNDNISKMQSDCRQASQVEKNLNEIISNLEKEKEELKIKNESMNKTISEVDSIKETNEKEIKELNEKIKKINEEGEKQKLFNDELSNNIQIYQKENISLKNQVSELKKDIELYTENNDAINEKNEEISRKNDEIEKLKSSYKFLEDSKSSLEKEKNEEIELYKNQILDMSNELLKYKEEQNTTKENENIEKLYLEKIQSLESYIEKIENENITLKKKDEENKKEMDNLIKKVNNDLKDTESLIDKRVISSVLVSYFDKSINEKVKENLLETLSSIMQYSNEDRKKMGLKPIDIPNKNKKEEDKLKKVSDGLYNFILSS